MNTKIALTRYEAVALLIGFVLVGCAFYLSGEKRIEAAGTCDAKFDQCMSQPGKTEAGCRQETQWDACVTKTCMPVGDKCPTAPECQPGGYCTEEGTSEKGRISCCSGGPKMGPHKPNPCPDKIDGKCGTPEQTKGTEGEKPKEEPKKEEPKGGEAKPPELPKAPESKPKPEQPKQDQKQLECAFNPTDPSCNKDDQKEVEADNVEEKLNDLTKDNGSDTTKGSSGNDNLAPIPSGPVGSTIDPLNQGGKASAGDTKITPVESNTFGDSSPVSLEQAQGIVKSVSDAVANAVNSAVSTGSQAVGAVLAGAQNILNSLGKIMGWW